MDEDLYDRLKEIQAQLAKLGEAVEDVISAVCAKD